MNEPIVKAILTVLSISGLTPLKRDKLIYRTRCELDDPVTTTEMETALKAMIRKGWVEESLGPVGAWCYVNTPAGNTLLGQL